MIFISSSESDEHYLFIFSQTGKEIPINDEIKKHDKKIIKMEDACNVDGVCYVLILYSNDEDFYTLKVFDCSELCFLAINLKCKGCAAIPNTNAFFFLDENNIIQFLHFHEI